MDVPIPAAAMDVPIPAGAMDVPSPAGMNRNATPFEDINPRFAVNRQVL
jgi:hypothetical protein